MIFVNKHDAKGDTKTALQAGDTLDCHGDGTVKIGRSGVQLRLTDKKQFLSWNVRGDQESLPAFLKFLKLFTGLQARAIHVLGENVEYLQAGTVTTVHLHAVMKAGKKGSVRFVLEPTGILG